MAGWISLHRKLMDNPIYSNANMLKLWIHCLMKASHTKRDQLVGNQMVKLEVGQFVTGRNVLEDEFNKGTKKDESVSGRTLWRWMKNFEEWQMLSIKSTTKYSIVTITNWSEHQQHDQQVSNSRPADVQQVSTNNNVNNANNSNKDSTTTAPMIDSGFGEIGRTFEASLCRLSPKQKESLGMWYDDFNQDKSIILEAIKIADNRNRRSFGFFEHLLKEWANNKLTTVDQIRAHEKNKFGKPSNVHRFEPLTKQKEDEHKYDYGF